MGKTIKEILRQKSWSGKDVGLALVYSIIHDIKNSRAPGYAPLFSKEALTLMEDSLTKDEDRLVYGIYRRIYRNVVDGYNSAVNMYNRFDAGALRYYNQASDAWKADLRLAFSGLSPVIMSRSQYERELLAAESENRKKTESVNSLALSIVKTALHDPAGVPPILTDAIDRLKETPADSDIVRAYCTTNTLGYCQLKDGTRSDQVSEWEWDEKIVGMLSTTPEERYKLGAELFFNGLVAAKQRYLSVFGKPLPVKEERWFMFTLENYLRYSDGGHLSLKMDPALYSIQAMLDGNPDSAPDWHDYQELPAPISLYDALATGDLLLCYRDISEIEEDFPDLGAAALKAVKAIVPEAKGLRKTQYNKQIVSHEALEALGFPGYTVAATHKDIADTISKDPGRDRDEASLLSFRIKNAGIAIAQDPWPCKLDQSGAVIDTTIQEIQSDNLNRITTDKDWLACGTIDSSIIAPLRYILAFNALLPVLGEVYDIYNLNDGTISSVYTDPAIDSINKTIYSFYAKAFGTKEERERTRTHIKKNLRPLHLDDFKPTQESIDQLRNHLAALGYSAEAYDALALDSLLKSLGGI